MNSESEILIKCVKYRCLNTKYLGLKSCGIPVCIQRYIDVSRPYVCHMGSGAENLFWSLCHLDMSARNLLKYNFSQNIVLGGVYFIL